MKEQEEAEHLAREEYCTVEIARVSGANGATQPSSRLIVGSFMKPRGLRRQNVAILSSGVLEESRPSIESAAAAATTVAALPRAVPATPLRATVKSGLRRREPHFVCFAS